MKKILLVGIYDINSVSLAPQILKEYAENYAKPFKVEILIREFSIFNDSPQKIADVINKLNPDVIGFSVYIWNYKLVLEVIKKIEGTIILGGPQVTGIENQLIKDNPQIDIIVTGEGEIIFKELIEFFSGLGKLSEIKGITTKNESTNPGTIVSDLETIPSVYQNVLEKYSNITWISFETSRGCPMGCRYCSWSNSKQMRYYPLSRVKEELKIILRSPNLSHIYFCDSNLLLNPTRAKDIFNFIYQNKRPNQSIRFEFNAELLDDDLIKYLGLLTNSEFNFGIQTVNKKALAECKRTFNKNLFEKNYFKLYKKFPNALITIDLIYGLPGDDIFGYKDSLDYVISLEGVDRVLTNPLIVLPGSYFFKNRKKYGIKIQNYQTFLEKENNSFSEEDMFLARKYSFYVSVIYLNKLFKKRIKDFAKQNKRKIIDVFIEFMDSIPSALVDNSVFPDMIPSAKIGFEVRNKAFCKVIKNYSEIIKIFYKFIGNSKEYNANEYEDYFTSHYYKLKKLAGFYGKLD